MIVGCEFGGAVFELVERWAHGVAACEVGVGAELACQSLAQGGDVFGQLTDLFFAVG